VNSRGFRIAVSLATVAMLAAAPSATADDSASSVLAKWSVDAPSASPLNFANGMTGQRFEAAPGTPIDLNFHLGPDLSEGPYKPLTYSTGTWYESTYWTGPDWTRVGDRWHHPGNLTPSIRRFAVPRDGKVSVTGRVFKLHLEGDGIRAAIHHNDREIWSAEIDGKDAEGIDPKLSLDVQKGDSVRFIVDKRVAISCDTTGWDPIIAYEDGQAYQASKSFGKQQGEGQWFYEMESAAATPKAEPRLIAIDSDFVLHRFLVEDLKEPLSSSRWLPFFVLTDGHDQSCLPLLVTFSGNWTLSAAFDEKQALRVRIDGGAGQGTACEVSPRLGQWTAGLEMLHAGQDPATAEDASSARRAVEASYQRAVAPMALAPELDLFLAIQDDWLAEDEIDGSAEAYQKAIDNHLSRASELLVQRIAEKVDPTSKAAAERLLTLRQQASSKPKNAPHVYLQARLLKRQLLLSDPRMDTGPLLFCKRKPPSWSHLVAQYFGWRQRPGGGLFVLEQPGRSIRMKNILGDQLPQGNILEPCLSYDGTRIVFSFVACADGQSHDPADFGVNEKGGEDRYYHIYEVNVDGSGLRQLTSGRYDDMMPAYLPDGDIAFCSTRRRGYSRCFGPEYSNRWDVYTMHRMAADGSSIRRLSANDVNEWFPSVSNQGELLFARWDYIDRDAVTHQNLWAMRPDGTNPIAVWGNAVPAPHCMFQAKAIPGSGKFVFIASAHHSITAGPVCVVDPAIDRNADAAMQRITPGPFPEAESSTIPEYYESPWPLGEDLFLVAYSRLRLRFQGEHMRNPNPDNALGLYLIDNRGNRELIYRDASISSTNPIPLRARPTPASLPPAMNEKKATPVGEMVVSNVYEGLGNVEPGTIKRLRIVQLFPKSTPLANQPRIGFAGEENGRAILGTVPVEEDGSANFMVPANIPLYFQALDADGFAYQTMRSSTHVQPGERISCVGCHEGAMTAPPASSEFPLALRRRPSKIEPGDLGGRPFSYAETVQPVLDRRCVECHNEKRSDGQIDLTGAPKDGFTRSYWALTEGPVDWRKAMTDPTVLTQARVPTFPQRNQIQMTPPGGAYSARGSRLMSLLREGHEDVQLSPDELARLATWIDMNAIFYGVYDPEQQQRQQRGELVAMPVLQ
jgi:hydrazine synthase alpha subunit-like protein/WD40 repeat protein